jgi:hypothetical protein
MRKPHTHTTPHQGTTRTHGHIKAPNPTRTQRYIKAPSPTRTQRHIKTPAPHVPRATSRHPTPHAPRATSRHPVPHVPRAVPHSLRHGDPPILGKHVKRWLVVAVEVLTLAPRRRWRHVAVPWLNCSVPATTTNKQTNKQTNVQEQQTNQKMKSTTKLEGMRSS